MPSLELEPIYLGYWHEYGDNHNMLAAVLVRVEKIVEDYMESLSGGTPSAHRALVLSKDDFRNKLRKAISFAIMGSMDITYRSKLDPEAFAIECREHEYCKMLMVQKCREMLKESLELLEAKDPFVLPVCTAEGKKTAIEKYDQQLRILRLFDDSILDIRLEQI